MSSNLQRAVLALGTALLFPLVLWAAEPAVFGNVSPSSEGLSLQSGGVVSGQLPAPGGTSAVEDTHAASPVQEEPVPVPEPHGMLLLAVGALGIFALLSIRPWRR